MPLQGRIDYNPPIPRVPLRFTLGCALLRLQRDNYRHELQNLDIHFLHIKLYTLTYKCFQGLKIRVHICARYDFFL